MIRIAALNLSSSEDDDGITTGSSRTTKEAKEAEAYTLYNSALSLQRQGEVNKAENAFRDLLRHGFIREAAKLVEDETEGAVHPGLQLLYSINKNLATMALQRGQYREAVECYIEAVKIDTTEVTVWYKIGTIALKLYNFPLARLGFEQGLQCNPNHWPCLDHVVTLLYTMNDYWNCLHYISQALEKDYLYTKGLVLYKQILKEQPSLKSETAQFFENCDSSIHKARIGNEEADEYINEALELRQKRRELARVPDPLPIKLPKPISSYTWKCLGDCLIELYAMIRSTDPPQSMGLRVDLSQYQTCSHEKSEPAVVIEPEKMEITQTDEKNKAEEMMEQEPAVKDIAEGQLEVKDADSVIENPVSPVTPHQPEITQVAMDTVDTVNQDLPPGASPVVTSQPAVSSLDVSLSSPHVTSLPVTTSDPAVNSPLLTSALGNMPTVTTTVSASTALQDHTCAAPMESEDVARGRGRPPKRKRASTQWMDDFGVKRRSARVRNTYRQKEEEAINFQELLYAFLPSSLKHITTEESYDITDAERQQTQRDPSDGKATGEGKIETGRTKLSDSEDQDVKEFLEKNQKNGGTLCLMLHYVLALADRMDTVWTSGLSEVFLKVYSRLRKHLDLPDVFCLNESPDYVKSLSKASVMAAEFQLDQWMINKSRFSMSPGSSPRSCGVTQEDVPPHCKDDLWFITGLTCCGDVMGDQWTQHCIRVYWMKARFSMLQGQVEDALYSFHKTLEYLEYAEKHEQPTLIVLINCKMDSLISIDEVKKHQESLQRCQSLEETQKLYDSGNYAKVVEFLLQTFTQQQTKAKVVPMSTAVPERQAQLLLLQDSLYKLNDQKRGLVWGEVSFNEAVQCYKKASTPSLREEWSTTLSQICQNIIRVLEKDSAVLKEMPSTNLVRLTHNLIKIIDIIMSVSDTATEMPIGTTLPWILMYRVIKFEEDKIRAMQVAPAGKSGDGAEDMPSYLMLLSIAHEYLGRHSWCTKSKGAFLLFYTDVLKEMMQAPSTFKRDLEQSYEQCIYCLYSHPNKKGKARHLLDHNAPPIELTWDRAMELFEYFKPKSVPEFDSYKQDCVSGEVEFLLKKIAQLVPENEKPANMIDCVQEYIEGNTNTAPSVVTNQAVSVVSKELYYLLADYYFKNKEQAKAIRFYMNDICMNPVRLDSWAGMALARMSQLEQKLNSAELKMEMPVYKKSIAALRCFKRAIEIDDTNGKLWIEYGSLAYQLHSHASRQLKWQKWFPLNEELLQIATDSRQEMLQISYNCYMKASECENYENEEEWLQHYMIGKCLEKMKKSPPEYLDHYKAAAENLYEDGATYPKKITYAYSSPYLAVEALEMFYRLHVAVMKVLLSTKSWLASELDMLECYIDEAAESPFAKCQEKKNEGREASFIDSPSLMSLGLSPGPPTKKSRKGITSQDHTYSKQKSVTDSSDPEQSHDALPKGPEHTAKLTQSDTKATTQETESGVIDADVVVSKVATLVPKTEPMEVESVSDLKVSTDSSVSGSKVNAAEIVEDKSKAANMMELSAENLDELVTVTKDSSSGLSGSRDGVNSSSSEGNQVTRVGEDSKTRLYSDSASQSSVDRSVVTKQGSFGFELSLSSSSSSGLMEDSEGNITVKAKLQNYTVETSFSDKAVSMETNSDSQQSKTDFVKQTSSENSAMDSKDSSSVNDNSESVVTASVSNVVDFDEHDLGKDGESGPPQVKVEDDLTFPGSQGFQHKADELVDGQDVGTASSEKMDSMDEMKNIYKDYSAKEREEGIGSTDISTMEVDSQSKPEPIESDEENSEDSFLSEDSFDSIPSSVSGSSVGRSAGDSLSKSGGFLAQFSQFLAKSTDDVPFDSPVKSSPDVSADLSSAADSVIHTESAESTNNSLLVKLDTSQDGGTTGLKSNEEKLVYSSEAKEKDDKEKSSNVRLDNLQEEKGSEENEENKEENKEENIDIDTVGMVIDTLINDISQEEPVDKLKGDKQVDKSAEISNKEETKVLSDIDKEVQKQDITKTSESESKNIFETTKAILETLISDVCQKEDISDEKPESVETTDKESQKVAAERDSMETEESQSKVVQGEVQATKNEVKATKSDEDIVIIDDKEEGEIVNKDKDKMSDESSENKKGKEEVKKSDESLVKPEGTKDKDTLSKPGSSKQHKELIEKCMAALSLCLSRFPTHYKSLYRLAYAYLHSPYHKNLQKSHDLLLGNQQWQQQAHMPAQGLFGERKQNNFFQGVWKIPVDEVDRSGSFASHLNRSVKLLLQVLKEQKDVGKLHHVHTQLQRTPDVGKKYLRDGERVAFAKMAHQYCVDAIRARLPSLRECTDHARAVKCLMEVYKVYNHIQFKMHISQLLEANSLLEDTFKAVMGEEVKDDEEVLEQAIRFCQQEVQKKARIHHPSGGRSNLDLDRKDGSQSDSSFFSPERPSVSFGLSGMKPAASSPRTPSLSNTIKTIPSAQNTSGNITSTPELPVQSQGIITSISSSTSSPLSAVGKPPTKPNSFPQGKQSAQVPGIKTEEKSSLLREHLVSDLKSATRPKESEVLSGENFKVFLSPEDVPPMVTPATPVLDKESKFMFSSTSEQKSNVEDKKKDVVVIEISSSSDEEADTNCPPQPNVKSQEKGAVSTQPVKPSTQVSNISQPSKPVLSLTKQITGAYTKPSQTLHRHKAKIKITPVRSAVPKHGPKIKITPMKSAIMHQSQTKTNFSKSTVELSSQSDDSQSGGEKDDEYKPNISEESSSDDDHSPVRKKPFKYGSKMQTSNMSQAEVAALMAASRNKQYLDPVTGMHVDVMQHRKVNRPQIATPRPNFSSRQIAAPKQNFTPRQIPPQKQKQKPVSKASPASQELKISGSGVQVLDPVTGLFVNPNSHTIGFNPAVTSEPPDSILPSTAAGNVEPSTGQIANSDSQESDLVADPEKLFFDVKDWMDFD